MSLLILNLNDLHEAKTTLFCLTFAHPVKLYTCTLVTCDASAVRYAVLYHKIPHAVEAASSGKRKIEVISTKISLGVLDRTSFCQQIKIAFGINLQTVNTATVQYRKLCSCSSSPLLVID